MKRALLACLFSISAFGCAVDNHEVGPKDFVSGRISKISSANIITVDTPEGDYVIEVAHNKPFGSYGTHTTQNIMSVIGEGDQISFPKKWTYHDWPANPFVFSPPTEDKELFSPVRIGVVDPNDIKLLDRQ